MKVVRLSALSLAAFTPRKYSWYSFMLEAESTPGPQCGRKDYVNEKFQWHHRESNPRPSDLPQPTELPRSPPIILICIADLKLAEKVVKRDGLGRRVYLIRALQDRAHTNGLSSIDTDKWQNHGWIIYSGLHIFIVDSCTQNLAKETKFRE
jgi:hypothetical protein